MATTRTATRHSTNFSNWPRWASFALGVWLFISAFAWRHFEASQTNTWLVGLLIAVAAIGAMYAPSVRFANTLLAVWLFISTLWIYPAVQATEWNNAIVAILVFLTSLVPSHVARTRTTTGTTTTTAPGHPMTTARV